MQEKELNEEQREEEDPREKLRVILESGASSTYRRVLLPDEVLVSIRNYDNLIRLLVEGNISGKEESDGSFRLVLNVPGRLKKDQALLLVKAGIVSDLIWRKVVAGTNIDVSISKLWLDRGKATLVLGKIGQGYSFVDIEPGYIMNCIGVM